MPADLYLCLELEPANDEAIEGLPDALCFDGGAFPILASPLIDGPGWVRTWRTFTDRDAAIEWAKSIHSNTLITIPLNREGGEVLVDQID